MCERMRQARRIGRRVNGLLGSQQGRVCTHDGGATRKKKQGGIVLQGQESKAYVEAKVDSKQQVRSALREWMMLRSARSVASDVEWLARRRPRCARDE